MAATTLKWILSTCLGMNGTHNGHHGQSVKAPLLKLEPFILQGFDLNYVGMVIGPSFGYDKETDTMTVIPEKYSHKEVFKKRKDIKFSRDEYKAFIANVLNVLIKRGKYGLYLTAYDDALRARLLELNETGK